jgi:hypothetical protein
LKNKAVRPWGLGVLLCAVLATLFHYKVHFAWGTFLNQVREVRIHRIFIATVLIYVSVCFRAPRWAALLKSQKNVSTWKLVGPQFIGFTCVALFGSLGDLVRPYLVARQVQLPLASQIATYTIERMFDLGAAALIFSGALVFASSGTASPHRQTFLHVGIASLSATMFILCMAIAVRSLGAPLADYVEHSPLLPLVLRRSIPAKLRAFRAGLYTVASRADFLKVVAFSLTIWGLVAAAYVQVVHAFVQTPQLAGLSFSETMLLVAASIGGSLVQLPVIGWFTQIAATAATMHALLGVPIEAATACGALLLCVTFLFLIPGGLVFSHFTRLSLRSALLESERVAETVKRSD